MKGVPPLSVIHEDYRVIGKNIYPQKRDKLLTIPVMQRRRKTPEAMGAYPTMASYVSTSVVSLPKTGVNSESAASKSTSAAEARAKSP